MQSFRSHFLRRKLLVLSGSKSFAGARSLISSFVGARPLISSPVHFRSSSFHSSDRRWEEESRDSPASSVGVEVHKFSTYVDPLEGKIVTMQVADERDDNGGEAEASINTVAAAKVSSGSSSQELNSQETDENKQNSLSYAGVKRKSGKTKSTWVCENCGDIQAQWWGTCPNCQVVGKFKCFVESEVSKSRGAEISEALVSSWLPQESRISTPISLAEVTSGTDQSEWRIPPDRRWEEESRDSPASSVGVEVHKFSTYVDPLEGKIVTMQVADERDDNGGEAEVNINTVAAAKVSSGSSSQELNSQETDENKQNSLSYAGVKRKSGKTKTTWVCEDCGDIQAQWWGTCPNCQVVGKFKCFVESEVSKSRGAEISEALVSSWLPQESRISTPISLAEVTSGTDQSAWRIPLEGHFGLEFCRVLGGGLVPGSLVLIGGDPGVGKSTLLLQIAAILARGFSHGEPAPVVYASGEESIEQIGNRAQRMSITDKDLYLYSNTDIEDILEKITKLSPRALIVDSIQTVYLKGVTGSAGNVMQIKECTSALLRFAKQTNIPVFLSGHVTKTGDIAGPRILEHIVDAVFYMEGDRHTSYRLVRSVKNRFGSTDELGVFEMSEAGLQAVQNPSEIFLSEDFSDSDVLVGRAIAVTLDGSRTFLIEIQALCASDCSVRRYFNGIGDRKASLMIAVLIKQAGLKLQDNVIFLNVVGGFELSETAGDLAIAVAICSSFLEFPIPNNVAFIGEVGLGGELRSVPRIDKRLTALAKLGFTKCIIPETANKLPKSLNLDIEIIGCKNLKDVINVVFRKES
ncbi:DNA repair protein RadA-like isoform X1 [Zingiber officinale]|uniref:DNA repair protein RadA-like isoform X1 n=1 Tax=Zingiber officinale TaxID=94328 RepID=UPI001C4B4892|nr:DNA repair protein RadA-like isoform X1 [Zingiber officinale]